MLKNEEGTYAFLLNDKNIAKDLTKAQSEEFLKEIFLNTKNKINNDIKKYLEDIQGKKGIRKYLIKDVPSIKFFVNWFDNLTIEEFTFLLNNIQSSRKIKARLRHPGGLHEWLMVSRANIFKKWGVSANEIIKLRTKISEVIFIDTAGVHGGKVSTKAHNELLKLIDGSNNYNEFVKKLIIWADNRLKGGSKKIINNKN